MIYFYSWWRGIEKKFKIDFMFMVFTSAQSFLHWISSTIINYYFSFGLCCFLIFFCLFKHEKRYFFASWSFKLPLRNRLLICCLVWRDVVLSMWKRVEQKKIQTKKTVLYRGKKKSRRCVAMGINANESSNVGANMVTPCLDRQQFHRCYLAIEKHVSMKKAILSKQHDQNEIFITNVKFVNRTNVMAWSVEVASGILGKIMVINNGEFHSNRLKCWPLRSIYFLYFSH